ncbi:MAG: formate--tetrahydrofolate ligase [Ignavibacteriales bacterium]|nr:formate--tetrahydrofolate ligase [Ignavibacteriales bacterium]
MIDKNLSIKPIEEIAEKLGLTINYIEKHGELKAKIKYDKIKNIDKGKGKLIMVTAMSPTPAGEGKTTTTIGLVDALNKIGKKTIGTLREPSLGPVFGMKGGATGGGLAQIMPSDEINLHFTGDIHAITSAHNLLSAMIDNRLHFDSSCGMLDSRSITWKRVIDMGDRVLREIVVGIGGPLRGIARETGFDITAASEVMAILCLAKDIPDLKEKLGNILIGYSPDNKPVFAKNINANNAMTALLKDAIKPNLVQTLENNPVLVHGGPFANIAHGTNSIVATRLGLNLADLVVTESGFGSDLGAVKYFDIVVRSGEIPVPSCCILVATVRSLKYHGGVKLDTLNVENIEAVEKGFENLSKHIDNMKKFGTPFVVAINKFASDTEREIAKVIELCKKENARVAVNNTFAEGSQGGIDLANEILSAIEKDKNKHQTFYELDLPIIEKINILAKQFFGAKDVAMEGKIERKIKKIENIGFGNVPICIAKTQYSLSSDDKALGCPKDFTLIVNNASLSSGAGFVVVYCGDIMTMPGLPKIPSAERIDIDENCEITGLT